MRQAAKSLIKQGKEICAGKQGQNVRKYAQKCNPKIMIGSANHILSTICVTKYDDIIKCNKVLQNMMMFLYQKEVLIILSTLKSPFF